MPFRIIQGTYHVIGYSPDGDSIRFQADDPNAWSGLNGRKARLNTRGHAQLRIEAIDTLETHYKRKHQPAEFADSATRKLFKLLGIDDVVWTEGRTRVKEASDGVPGYIVSRETDRYGRPIAFLFAGKSRFDDGDEVYLGKTLGRKSINYKMLKYGLAYPTFYEGLFYDLRAIFVEQANEARKAKRGFWKFDKTNKAIQIDGFETIEEHFVMLPKLFRRIVAYLNMTGGEWDATAFRNWLHTDPERVFYMKYLHFTHFDNLLEVTEKGKIKLIAKPQDIVFLA